MKRTYIATSKIVGLEPPRTDKAGNVLGEHTLEAGNEYDMEEAAAQPFVAGGSLVLKNSPSKFDDDRFVGEGDKSKGSDGDKGRGK